MRVEGGSLNFYTYCDGDPINRYDPTGEIIIPAIFVAMAIGAVIGAVIGAAIGGGVEAYKQYKTDGEVKDWGKVGKAALIGGAIGAIGGAIGGAFPPAGATLAATIGLGALAGGVGSGAEYCAEVAFTDEEFDAGELAKSVLLGAGIGAVTAGIGGLIAAKLARRAARAKKLAQELDEARKLKELEELKKLQEAAAAKKAAEDAIAAAKAKAKQDAQAKLAKHNADVAAHKKKYEDALADAKKAGKSKASQGGQKAKITEAIGEEAAAKHMATNFPDHEMISGFAPGTGFDQVYVKRGATGEIEEILIVEAKGPGAELLEGAAKGDQMTKKWVENSAKEWGDSGDAVGKQVSDALKNGPPPKVTGKVIQATDTGGAVEVPCPDGGIFN